MMTSHTCVQRLVFSNLNIRSIFFEKERIILGLTVNIESDDSGVKYVSCIFRTDKHEFIGLELRNFQLAIKIMEQNAAPESCINLVKYYLERWT